MSQDIKRFAEKVERLCDRLVCAMDHSDDRTAIMKLRDEAGDLATGKRELLENTLVGVSEDLR